MTDPLASLSPAARELLATIAQNIANRAVFIVLPESLPIENGANVESFKANEKAPNELVIPSDVSGAFVSRGSMDDTLNLFLALRALDKSQNPADRREWERLRSLLCEKYNPLVVSIARRMLATLSLDEGNDLDDLISIGLEALIKAVDAFDPEVGISFARFATPRIEGAMRHYKRDNVSIIREPAYLQERRSKAKGDEKPITAYGVGLVGQSSPDGSSNSLDLASDAPYSVGELATARAVLSSFLSHLDRLASKATGRTRDALVRERRVIELHFRGQPAVEIARRLDCSESNVAVHIRGGLERLKQFSNCEN